MINCAVVKQWLTRRRAVTYVNVPFATFVRTKTYVLANETYFLSTHRQVQWPFSIVLGFEGKLCCRTITPCIGSYTSYRFKIARSTRISPGTKHDVCISESKKNENPQQSFGFTRTQTNACVLFGLITKTSRTSLS